MLKPLAGFIALCLTQHVEPEIESETLESGPGISGQSGDCGRPG